MIALQSVVPPGMVLSLAPQGSEEWLAARRGVLTASNFKLSRDRLKNGAPSAKAMLYAKNVAREIIGGVAPSPFETRAMGAGKAKESPGRIAYEAVTGHLVDEAGFLHTEDRKFGCSIDGLILLPRERGGIEIKTMVSSDTLFTALIDGDISEYVDQCHGNIWLWHLDWIDLVLYAPDMPGDLSLKVIRIERDDNYIEALQQDLLAFDGVVQGYVARLAKALHDAAEIPDAPPPANPATVAAFQPPAPASATTALPSNLFA